MLTGEIRNQIDRIWDAFWSGGISTPLEVIEQITYLLFLKRLKQLNPRTEPCNTGTSNSGNVKIRSVSKQQLKGEGIYATN